MDDNGKITEEQKHEGKLVHFWISLETRMKITLKSKNIVFIYNT